MKKWYLEGLDELLQDLMGNTIPFGGKHLIIESDLGQTLLIIEKKSIAEHFDMCIRNLDFCHKLKQHKLVKK